MCRLLQPTCTCPVYTPFYCTWQPRRPPTNAVYHSPHSHVPWPSPFYSSTHIYVILHTSPVYSPHPHPHSHVTPMYLKTCVNCFFIKKFPRSKKKKKVKMYSIQYMSQKPPQVMRKKKRKTKTNSRQSSEKALMNGGKEKQMIPRCWGESVCQVKKRMFQRS